MTFCCSHFYENLLFPCIYIFTTQINQTMKLCQLFCSVSHFISKIEQDYTGEKPFNFHHCNRKFCQNYNLRVHDWIQIWQKPFNCHHCDKKFVQKNDLRVHERIHTGEKTFNCKSVTTVTRSSISVNYNCIINSTPVIEYLTSVIVIISPVIVCSTFTHDGK